jgi:hypothetical protein
LEVFLFDNQNASRVNQVNGSRPEFVWENWEGLFYAYVWLPLVQAAPEFCAFMESAWVFNRALEWHDEGLDGCPICCSASGDLSLTGESQVSSWHSDSDDVVTHHGGFARFEKKSWRRCRDCAVLPCFQFQLGPHPRVEVKVTESSANWQFCLSLKGRSGPPFASSGWRQEILIRGHCGVCGILAQAANEVFAKAFEKVLGGKLVRKALEEDSGAISAFERQMQRNSQ